jgi:hypothetical protein
MVADFPELHQHVHYAEEVRISESLLGFVHVDVLVVQETLSSAEIALYNMFHLLRQLLFYVFLHPAQQKRSQDRLKLLHNSDVERLVLIDTLTKWIGKPLLEVLLVAENLRHQKVHE